jgi:hypothetical protein
MYQNNRNAFGCPLSNQTGEAGVRNFSNIVNSLPPDLRQAFERERAARQRELEQVRDWSPPQLVRRVLSLF